MEGEDRTGINGCILRLSQKILQRVCIPDTQKFVLIIHTSSFFILHSSFFPPPSSLTFTKNITTLIAKIPTFTKSNRFFVKQRGIALIFAAFVNARLPIAYYFLMENNIPAYHEVFSLVQRIFEVTSKVPKEQHNDMVEMLIRSGSELLRSLVRTCKTTIKEHYLEPLWADFEILKMEILACCNAGLIKPETHRELDMLVNGIEQKWAPLGYPPTKPRH